MFAVFVAPFVLMRCKRLLKWNNSFKSCSFTYEKSCYCGCVAQGTELNHFRRGMVLLVLAVISLGLSWQTFPITAWALEAQLPSSLENANALVERQSDPSEQEDGLSSARGGKLPSPSLTSSFPEECFSSLGEKQESVAAVAFLQRALTILLNLVVGLEVSLRFLLHFPIREGREVLVPQAPHVCGCAPLSLCRDSVSPASPSRPSQLNWCALRGQQAVIVYPQSCTVWKNGRFFSAWEGILEIIKKKI